MGIGTISACFQVSGSRASAKEQSMMSATTGANKSAFSFSSQDGIMSGPEALAGFSVESFLNTQCSEIKGGLGWRTSVIASGAKAPKMLMGSRKALLIVLARVVGPELSPVSMCLRADIGSDQVADIKSISNPLVCQMRVYFLLLWVYSASKRNAWIWPKGIYKYFRKTPSSKKKIWGDLPGLPVQSLRDLTPGAFFHYCVRVIWFCSEFYRLSLEMFGLSRWEVLLHLNVFPRKSTAI